MIGDSALIFANNLSLTGLTRTGQVGQVNQSTIATLLRSVKAPASVENVTAGKVVTRIGRNGMIGDSAPTFANNLS